MITTVLRSSGADPGYVIGGDPRRHRARRGRRRRAPDFVAEADESDGSFLMLAPDAAVVTSVEADHLDNYGTAAAYRGVVRGVRQRGSRPAALLVTCADDPGARDLAAAAAGRGLRVRTYGESADADYRVTGRPPHGMETVFRVQAGGRPGAGHRSQLQVCACPAGITR